MYSVNPAAVVLIESYHGSMTMRTGKDLRDLISEVLHNSGDEFAFWAEQEAAKAANVWRAANEADKAREASGIHDEDCECSVCLEAYDKAMSEAEEKAATDNC